MFGVPKSVNILNKINDFVSKDKNNKNYKVIVAPPFTLLESFSKIFKKKQISISSQNSYHKDYYSSDTGAISSYMIKKLKCEYIIIGHSDNRAQGDSDKIIKDKIKFAIKNNLKVIFCIGENKKQKFQKKTLKVLNRQIKNVIEKKLSSKKIIFAYEPIWSIGTGIIPGSEELTKISKFINKTVKNIFKNNKNPSILYGGSVESSNIEKFREIEGINGFLIGGASKSSKKFIDIIKNYYR